MLSAEQTIDPAKVAIYIRWSTEDQSEGTTLDVQRDTNKAYLVSQGWVVNEDLIFIDDGYSGGSLDRPALTKLRKAVGEGQVDCVVVYKLDRLSRSVVDTVTLAIKEWEGKCSVKSAREPIDTTSHAGRMFFYTLVNYAEWERSVIKERTYSGKLRRAQEGRNPGYRAPYGYKNEEGGSYSIVEEEAAIVRKIYDLYLTGMGVRMITSLFNREGLKPRETQAWVQSTVAKILKNPAYTGKMEYGKRRRVGNGRVNKEPLVVKEGVFPPIIPLETWDMVQAAKLGKPGFGRAVEGSGRSATSDNLLSGLLKCKGCGHGFCGKSSANGGKYRYYRCLGVVMKSSAYCGCGGIRQEALDAKVVEGLRALYGGQEARGRLTRQMAVKYEKQLVEARATLQTLEKELKRVETGEQRLKRLLRDGELTVAEYRELREDMERETEEVKEAHQKALAAERQALAGLKGQARLMESLSKVDEWAALDLRSRKLLLRQFIQEIRVFKAPKSQAVECHIVWRWDSGAAGAPPVAASSVAVEQPRPLPPRNEVRDGLGRFAKRSST